MTKIITCIDSSLDFQYIGSMAAVHLIFKSPEPEKILLRIFSLTSTVLTMMVMVIYRAQKDIEFL